MTEQQLALAIKFIGFISPLVGATLWVIKREETAVKKAQIRANADIAIAKENSAGITAIKNIRDDIEEVRKKYKEIDDRQDERFRELGESIRKLSEHFTKTLIDVLRTR